MFTRSIIMNRPHQHSAIHCDFFSIICTLLNVSYYYYHFNNTQHFLVYMLSGFIVKDDTSQACLICSNIQRLEMHEGLKGPQM